MAKKHNQRAYTQPFTAEKVFVAPDNDRGWRVTDATGSVCKDTDGHWLWANKASAQAFIRDLNEKHK